MDNLSSPILRFGYLSCELLENARMIYDGGAKADYLKSEYSPSALKHSSIHSLPKDNPMTVTTHYVEQLSKTIDNQTHESEILQSDVEQTDAVPKKKQKLYGTKCMLLDDSCKEALILIAVIFLCLLSFITYYISSNYGISKHTLNVLSLITVHEHWIISKTYYT
jgi:hypothetical protein